MNAEQTREAIKVMQHFADGGRVQARSRHHPDDWDDLVGPVWNWDACEYRIAREPLRAWVVVNQDGWPLDAYATPECADATATFKSMTEKSGPYCVVEMIEATK